MEEPITGSQSPGSTTTTKRYYREKFQSLEAFLSRKFSIKTWIDGTNGGKFWLKAFFLPQAFLTAVQLNFARTMSEVSKKKYS